MGGREGDIQFGGGGGLTQPQTTKISFPMTSILKKTFSERMPLNSLALPGTIFGSPLL